MNHDHEQFIAEQQRINDLLVQLGYARSVVIDDKTMKGSIHWTPDGDAVRKQLAKTYHYMMAKGKDEADGTNQFLEFLMWLAKMR